MSGTRVWSGLCSSVIPGTYSRWALPLFGTSYASAPDCTSCSAPAMPSTVGGCRDWEPKNSRGWFTTTASVDKKARNLLEPARQAIYQAVLARHKLHLQAQYNDHYMRRVKKHISE